MRRPRLQTDITNTINQIEQLLIPPVLLEDEKTSWTVRPLALISVFGIILAAAYALVWPIIMPERAERIVLALLLFLPTGLPLILIRRERIVLARGVLLSGVWLIVTISALTSGGTRAPIFGLYIVIVMVAALLSGWRLAFMYALITIFMGFVLVLFDPAGIKLTTFASPLSAWLSQTAIMVTVTVAAYFVLRQTRQALSQAEQALSALNKAQQSLFESEARYRLISTVTSDYTYSSRLNAQGELEHLLLTGAFETITGYTPEEFLSVGGWRAALHPDDLEQDERDMTVLRENRPVETEVRTIRKDGEVRWVHVNALPIWDQQNARLIGINGGVQDITQRKLAEEALRESERRYRAVSEMISDYAFAYDIYPDGSFGTAWITDASFKRLTGYDWHEIGATYKLYHPDDAALAQAHVQQTIKGQATSGEYRIFTKSGELRWLHISRRVEWDEAAGRFTRFYGAAQDITERKQSVEALRESEERFRTFIQQSSECILLTDEAGTIIEWNEAFSALTGLPHEEAVGQPIWVIQMQCAPPAQRSPAYLENIKANTLIALQTGEWPAFNRQIETVIYRRDGTYRQVQQSLFRIRSQRGWCIGAIFLDISERKRAEDAVRRSEAHLRALLDATTDVAFLMALDGTLLTLNAALADSMGRTVKEMIGFNALDSLREELRDQRARRFDAVAQTGQPERWEDQSGDSDWWDNSVYPIFSPDGAVEAYAIYCRDISEQKRMEAELQEYANRLEKLVDERTNALRRTKEQLELVLNNTANALAFADPTGDILVTNPAFRAIFTEQGAESIEFVLWSLIGEEQVALVSEALLKVIHDSEIQRVETRVISEEGQEKDVDLVLIPISIADDALRNGVLLSGHDITQMKEVERFKARFVADAVHDLATPIAGLSTRLYLLKRTPENLSNHMRALENQVQHLRNLLEDLRTLSQIDRQQITLTIETHNMNDLVQRVYDIYEPVALDKQQSLELNMTPTLPPVALDRHQIERVLVNLVSNAINYTPECRTVRIETDASKHDVIVRVIDEGMGIGEEDLPHIFDRFYRTSEARKTQSSGSGLGLAITKEIIEMHGGSITATSRVGHGSTFTLRLPI